MLKEINIKISGGLGASSGGLPVSMSCGPAQISLFRNIRIYYERTTFDAETSGRKKSRCISCSAAIFCLHAINARIRHHRHHHHHYLSMFNKDQITFPNPRRCSDSTFLLQPSVSVVRSEEPCKYCDFF